MEETVQHEGKSFLSTALLCWFLGNLGAHRFYTGYIGLGIIQLLTFGGLGIWCLIDLVSICTDNYKDAQGQELYAYNKTTGTVIITIFFLSAIGFALSAKGP